MAIIDIADIVNMLTDRLDALCVAVLPRGRREGHDWVEASTARGGLGDSLKVCLNGARRGVFVHFANGNHARGDALELIAYVMFNGDKKKAIAWAKSWLGLDSNDPARIKQQRLKAAANQKKREAEFEEQVERRKRGAKALWLNASEKVIGSPVDFYLMGRGIGLSDLPKVPGSLRYAHSLKHPDGHLYPAMVAAIHTASGEFTGVHRTFLSKINDTTYKKAALGQQAKMVYGPYAGGFIPLSRGASGDKFKDGSDSVILCEGIEDGLSLALALPQYRVLSCISVGNFQNIRLPQNMRHVVIAADNDAPDSAAGRALQAAVDRFIDEGRDVEVAHSPVGKDFNDCLVHHTKAGVA